MKNSKKNSIWSKRTRDYILEDESKDFENDDEHSNNSNFKNSIFRNRGIGRQKWIYDNSEEEKMITMMMKMKMK